MKYTIDLPESLARQLEQYAATHQQSPEEAIAGLLAGDMASSDQAQMSEAEAHAKLMSLYGVLADDPIPETLDALQPEPRPELDNL